MASGADAWTQYGPAFLDRLERDRDWRAVETLWRAPAVDLPRVAKVMARSGDAELTHLLADELADARYETSLPNLPDLLHANRSRVDVDRAERVLRWLEDPETAVSATYIAKAPLLYAWVLGLSGSAIDEVAASVAIGSHAYAEIDDVLEAAIERIASSPDLGAEVVERMAAAPDIWATGNGWVRTTSLLARLGRNPRGRADLVRTLITDLFTLPASDGVSTTPEFEQLVERHAAEEVRSAFSGEPLTLTPSTTAAVRMAARFGATARERLVESLAAHQPVLWSALRSEIVSGWTHSDWERMLTIWSAAGSGLTEPEALLAMTPSEHAALKIRVAVVHGATPGDGPAQSAVPPLQALATGAGEDAQLIPAVANAVPWDLVDTADRLEYVRWMLEQALSPGVACAVVMKAYTEERLSAENAADLIPDGEYATAFAHLDPGPPRTRLARALYPMFEAGHAGPVFATIISNDAHALDLVEAIAPLDPTAAFSSFDLNRWHDQLDSVGKEVLLSLLEAYATVEQAEILDLIAADSDGRNTDRRGRAAKRWAELTPLHSTIPPGVLTLLSSALASLNEAFAAVAATVQPRDVSTLSSLKTKWLSGSTPGSAARDALDTISAGVVNDLSGLRTLDRHDRGPELLRMLGLAASKNSFATLLSYVGAEAVDDNLALRQTAAESIVAFVEVTRLEADDVIALGLRLATESDPLAVDNLQAALSAAKLGDDAAILGLYELVGTTTAPPQTPDELFGSEKERLLTAVKKMHTQRALGRAGWDSYVEQMNLLAEALVRAAYLKFGTNEGLRGEIRSGRPNKPEYGNLLGALRSTEGFGAAVPQLETLYDARKTRTSAHYASGGPLDSDTVIQCENALKLGAQAILQRLLQEPTALRAVQPARSNVVS